MLVAKALQPLSQRTGAEIGAAAHYQAGWFPAGMGIDDPDPMALFINHVRSFRPASDKEPCHTTLN